MKFLIWLSRLLYITFVTFSSGVMSMIILFIIFDINKEELKPIYWFVSFIINIIILDVFFINPEKIKKLLGIGKKKNNRIMPYKQMVGRALRTNKKPVKINFLMVNSENDNSEEHF